MSKSTPIGFANYSLGRMQRITRLFCPMASPSCTRSTPQDSEGVRFLLEGAAGGYMEFLEDVLEWDWEGYAAEIGLRPKPVSSDVTHRICPCCRKEYPVSWFPDTHSTTKCLVCRHEKELSAEHLAAFYANKAARRERLNAHRRELIDCSCGSRVTRAALPKHLRSYGHRARTYCNDTPQVEATIFSSGPSSRAPIRST